MTPQQVIVREDGAYLVLDDGREIPMGGLARVTARGHVVVRYPARDVTVVAPIDHRRAYDASDVLLMRVAVLLCGLTLQQLQSIRPAVAALVNNWLQTNGFSPGDVE